MFIDQISQWMRQCATDAGAKGFVVGISGGVDSAVVTALACRAVGEENVLGLIMPCHSQSDDTRLAWLVAETFDVEIDVINLGFTYDALVDAMPWGTKLARANLKPRLRMATLYHAANTLNYLVAGTGNKSELMVGYFTKYGDGGVDILPLGDLYKSQVWELARELGVPEPVIERAPTAGLWPGQTDEGEMGLSYAALDAVLKELDTGREPTTDSADVMRVRHMVESSAHKRALPPIFTGGDCT